MTEEVKVEDTEQVQEVQLTPVEQEAIEHGWVPKDEFQGDEHKWVEAGEFIRRGELFKKIEDQNRELKQVRQALNGFKEHYTKVEEASYQRALTALKQEFKTANREGDFDKADRLETQIESVEQEAAALRKNAASQPQQAEANPDFVAWVAKNDWYHSQVHMKAYADQVGIKFANLGMSPREVLQKVDAEVRKEFPTKFTNPNREKGSAVADPTSRASSRKSDTYELTDQERRVMNSLVASKVLTKEEYIADLKKSKGVA